MEEVTHLYEKGILGIYQCNNCGAYASLPGKIEHYSSCVQGEAKKWEKNYDDTNEKEVSNGSSN